MICTHTQNNVQLGVATATAQIKVHYHTIADPWIKSSSTRCALPRRIEQEMEPKRYGSIVILLRCRDWNWPDVRHPSKKNLIQSITHSWQISAAVELGNYFLKTRWAIEIRRGYHFFYIYLQYILDSYFFFLWSIFQSLPLFSSDKK